MFCRLGGEEFLIVMVAGSVQKLEQRLEKIREAIHTIDVDTLGINHAISASIGVSLQLNQSKWMSVSEHITRADNALYQAKAAGRNRVCQFRAN